jgi:hypothetical protein
MTLGQFAYYTFMHPKKDNSGATDIWFVQNCILINK